MYSALGETFGRANYIKYQLLLLLLLSYSNNCRSTCSYGKIYNMNKEGDYDLIHRKYYRIISSCV